MKQGKKYWSYKKNAYLMKLCKEGKDLEEILEEFTDFTPAGIVMHIRNYSDLDTKIGDSNFKTPSIPDYVAKPYRWNDNENIELLKLYKQKLSPYEIAYHMERSKGGIDHELRKLFNKNIKLSSEMFNFIVKHYTNYEGRHPEPKKYMTHDKMRKLLVNISAKKFIQELFKDETAHSTYYCRFYREISVNPHTSSSSENIPYMMDDVVLVDSDPGFFPNEKLFLIGIELKGSRQDIHNLLNIQKYYAYTDLFYVGVPSGYIEEACYWVQRVMKERPEINNKLGLFDVETGEIVILAEKKDISDSNRIDFRDQLSKMKYKEFTVEV